MMNETVKVFERKHSRLSNQFPNTSVAGYYDAVAQAVNASSVSIDQVKAFAQNPNFFQLMDVWGTILHEITHWMQHVSTLWGQINLISLYDAFSARLSGDVDTFYRIADYRAFSNRTCFPKYYTYFGPSAGAEWDGNPWHWKLSCGREFGHSGRLREDRPILFAVFYTSNGDYVCRVPFSIASLLLFC